MQSINSDVFTSNTAAIEKIIQSAYAKVFTYIGWSLSVTDFVEYFELEDYKYIRGLGYKITPSRTPVRSAVDAHKHGDDWIVYDLPKLEARYSAGYTVLPDDVTEVAFACTVYEMNRSLGNLFNTSTKTISTGGVNVNITKSPDDFYAIELAKVDKYRSKAFYSTVTEAPSES